MMKSRIRVSIGIPTYNQAEYLEETILSVLNQTVPAYEIFVSNNHSTDDTVPSTGANYRYQYRENIQIKRLEQETLDQAIIINSIIGDIFKKHKLDLKLYELAKGIYLNHRLKLYKKNKIDYSDMLELYNIDISMMQKYGFWSRLILYIRERILKR